SLAQSPRVGRKTTDIPRVQGDHGAVQERTSFVRPAANHREVAACQRQHVQIADELLERRFLAVDVQPLLAAGEHDLKVALDAAALDAARYERSLLGVSYALARRRRTEAAAVSEQVDCFQEVGLALAIGPYEEVGAGRKFDFSIGEIAKAGETEPKDP